MTRRPPRSTRTDTLFPYTTLFRSDRLHQADIALLDKIQKLKAAIGVFVGDGNDETKVRLNHFLFGDPRFPFALLHHVDDATEFGKRHAGGLRSFRDFSSNAIDSRSFLLRERSEESRFGKGCVRTCRSPWSP